MTSVTNLSMVCNLFDFVLHGERLCILVDYDDHIKTLLTLHFYEKDGSFCTLEYDTSDDVDLYEEEVSPIMERLRAFRMCHDTSFGFIKEELSLIHSF